MEEKEEQEKRERGRKRMELINFLSIFAISRLDVAALLFRLSSLSSTLESLHSTAF